LAVAGIAGVPLDRLVQRDSQRQVRRVMAITGMVALVAIAMGVMTMIALQARNEAQTLRVSSDAFIDELLTDGREDLIAVGRIDILDRFNERSLRFFERLGDPSRLPPDSLQLWARNLQAIGEDETKKKPEDRDLDKALTFFRSARTATEELLKREPENPDRIFAHGHSVYWIGRVDELRRDLAAAEVHYLQFRDLGLKLVEVDPKSSRAALQRGYGELNIGILEFEKEQYLRAGKIFDQAIEWFEEAHKRTPDDRPTQGELANAYAWRFDTHYKLDEFEEALAARTKSLRITRSMIAEEPDDTEAQFSEIIAMRAIAMTRCRLGDAENAQSDLAEIVPKMRRLTSIDPGNGEWAAFRDVLEASVSDVATKGKCSANFN